jgi:hypothetical protein
MAERNSIIRGRAPAQNESSLSVEIRKLEIIPFTVVYEILLRALIRVWCLSLTLVGVQDLLFLINFSNIN